MLAGTLDDIHSEYSISEKIIRTTTDSGSNFIKAFKVYGEKSQEELIGGDLEAVTLVSEEDGEEVVFRTSASALDMSYKKLTLSTFAKCQALYNKTSKSTINAEIVQEECKLQFIQPRWNSV